MKATKNEKLFKEININLYWAKKAILKNNAEIARDFESKAFELMMEYSGGSKDDGAKYNQLNREYTEVRLHLAKI